MQSVPDNAYRGIWNHKRGLAKLRMQKEHVNAYEIKGQLGIASMRIKIETRTLSGIGHIPRMPNERPTKRIIFGTWDHKPEVRGGLKRCTLWYWRKLLGEAGIDWTNTENLSRNRKGWKNLVKKREIFLIDWEEKMRLTGPQTTQGTEHGTNRKKPKASHARGKAAPEYADQKEVSPIMKGECTINRTQCSSVHDA